MKTFQFLFLFFILFAEVKISSAQIMNYLDSIISWNEYNEFVFYPGNWQYTDYNGINFKVDGDTMFNGVPYKKLFYGETWWSHLNASPWSWSGGNYYPVSYELMGALRKDSTGKLFFYNTSPQWSSMFCFFASMPQNSEVLLYNFDLNVGDTVYSSAMGNSIVTSVDSMQLLNGDWRKRINFYYGDSWIEGMGSIYGLFVPFVGIPFEGGCYLNCYAESEGTLYQNTNLTDIAYCDSISLGTLNISEKHFSTMAFPNPATIFITFDLHNLTTSDCKIAIYNSTGQLIHQFSTHHSTQLTIPVSEIGDNGMYFYTMIVNEEKYFAGKFLIQR